MRATQRVAVCICALVAGARIFAAEQYRLPETVAPGAKLTTVYADDKMFFEGPVWEPKTQRVYFTAFSRDNSQILYLDASGKVTLWLDHSEGVNGMYLSADGRLLGAQGFARRIVSYDLSPEGPRDTKVLCAAESIVKPNDICQAPDGAIYFTDPDFKALKDSAVYRVAPDGKGVKVITDMPAPNGVIASLDGRTLYVSDSHQKEWRAYPVNADGTVGPGRVFFKPDTPDDKDPDGMSIDEFGNLYFCGRGGVWAVSPEGTPMGLILIPEFCSNATFGGADGKVLYITCDKKLYSIQMKVRGGQFVKKAS
jgi:gluconolactonase